MYTLGAQPEFVRIHDVQQFDPKTLVQLVLESLHNRIFVLWCPNEHCRIHHVCSWNDCLPNFVSKHAHFARPSVCDKPYDADGKPDGAYDSSFGMESDH